ncbi:MAG: PIN domain-containing protein [Gallionella sp.]|nr:PIN domain-containing protein [Gallionella sp.]MDP1940154.1 PIN domain-containing protein [Gallionella sp.]
MSLSFLDSNIILYLLSADIVKADKAEAIVAGGGVVSVQVLNEITSVCRRKLKMPWGDIEAVLTAVKSACNVTPLTITTHETAVKIAQRYDISFYDANICAAAILSGAKILVSEDMQDGMNIDGVIIQNPFR